MLKRLVRDSFQRLGLTVARGDLRAENARLFDELTEARGALVSTADQLAATREEVGGLRAARDAAAAAAAALARESARTDPPVRKRLKDAPEVFAAVRTFLDGAGLFEQVNAILTDPEFSPEDRERYMKLFHHVYPEYYDRTMAAIATIINGQYIRWRPREADQGPARRAAEELRREGVVRLGTPFSPDQVRDIQKFFRQRPIFNGHVPMSARHRTMRRYVNHTAENYPIGCYSGQDIALAPHLLEFALSPRILDTAAAYFGCAPRLSWLQSWWNFAGPGDYPHRQNFFHRDTNDFGMFWVYIYLTDVGPGNGPHRLIRRSADFAVVRERFERAKA
ncbi:MAG TPA: phytanoyl-CoA dioxygenase family protein, partial [Gemmataceae bacterium]|nr:phytanoyl-CoA dioxygenase family protein [Gemmataceae bacterium]